MIQPSLRLLISACLARHAARPGSAAVKWCVRRALQRVQLGGARDAGRSSTRTMTATPVAGPVRRAMMSTSPSWKSRAMLEVCRAPAWSTATRAAHRSTIRAADVRAESDRREPAVLRHRPHALPCYAHNASLLSLTCSPIPECTRSTNKITSSSGGIPAARRRRRDRGGGGRRRAASSRPGHALWSAPRRGPAPPCRRAPRAASGSCHACAEIKSEFE